MKEIHVKRKQHENSPLDRPNLVCYNSFRAFHLLKGIQMRIRIISHLITIKRDKK